MDVIADVMRNIWLQALFSLIIGYSFNVNYAYSNKYELIHGWLMKVMWIFLLLCATMDFHTIYLITILLLISIAFVFLLKRYFIHNFKKGVKKCY